MMRRFPGAPGLITVHTSSLKSLSSPSVSNAVTAKKFVPVGRLVMLKVVWVVVPIFV